MHPSSDRLATLLAVVGALALVIPACDRSSSEAGGTSSSESQQKQAKQTDARDQTSDKAEASSDASDEAALGDDYNLEGRVLVVLSGADELELEDGSTIETGFFMNELAIPGRAMTRAGLDLTYTTPDGDTPNMDPSSNKASYFENRPSYEAHLGFLQDEDLLEGSADIRSFDDILEEGLSEYVAVFVPGGLAPTVDLATHPALGEIIGYFHSESKPTAMLCHGPAAMLSTLDEPQSLIETVHAGEEVESSKNWIYRDYEMTVISEKEDKQTEEKLGGGLKFYPERVLRQAGARVEVKDREKGFVTRHKELITGQNPISDREFTRAILESIEARQ